MINLSIVLIVKNESENLEKCLNSVQNLAAEIIVLDSGSTDNTIEIAKTHTNKVFVNDNWQGFGKQRQIAQSYASYDWILMLDADEVLTDKLFEEIKIAVNTNNQNKIYSIPRLSFAFGSYIKHGGWYPDYVSRLYPRLKTSYNSNLVHEKLIVPKTMKIKKLKSDLIHYTYKNLEHYLIKSAQYSTAWAEQRKFKNKKSSILKGLGHGTFCFFRMYFFRMGFLDGKQGLLLALLSAHSVFVKYASLWLMNQSDKK